MSSPFIRPLDHAQGRNDKPYKYTFLQSPRLLVGINCLLPGQRQNLHDHADQDKFYYVLEGKGIFQVGDVFRECRAGDLILCEAGEKHGVENRGLTLLSFLTVLAPTEP